MTEALCSVLEIFNRDFWIIAKEVDEKPLQYTIKDLGKMLLIKLLCFILDHFQTIVINLYQKLLYPISQNNFFKVQFQIFLNFSG
jgi:hypothetical protein